MSTPELDADIARRFGPDCEALLAGRLDSWRGTPLGALAGILLGKSGAACLELNAVLCCLLWTRLPLAPRDLHQQCSCTPGVSRLACCLAHALPFACWLEHMFRRTVLGL